MLSLHNSIDGSCPVSQLHSRIPSKNAWKRWLHLARISSLQFGLGAVNPNKMMLRPGSPCLLMVIGTKHFVAKQCNQKAWWQFWESQLPLLDEFYVVAAFHSKVITICNLLVAFPLTLFLRERRESCKCWSCGRRMFWCYNCKSISNHLNHKHVITGRLKIWGPFG